MTYRQLVLASVGFLCLTMASCGGGGSNTANESEVSGDTTGASWTRFIGTSESDAVTGVDVGPSGEAFIGGYMSSTVDDAYRGGKTNAFVAKYSSSGERAWRRTIGNRNIQGTVDVAADSSGNVYLFGSSDAGDIAGKSVAPSSGDRTATGFIAKYNGSGDRQWVKLAGTIGGTRAVAGEVGPSDNAFLLGATLESLHDQSHIGRWDGFVSKYTASGDRKWTRIFGGHYEERPNDIVTNTNGSLFVAGSTRYFQTGDEEPLGGSEHHGGDFDAFAVKFDSSGSQKWNSLVGTPVKTGEERGYGIAADDAGNVYLTGTVQRDLYGRTHTGVDEDAFLVKHDPSGDRVWTHLVGGEETDVSTDLGIDSSGTVYLVGWTEHAFQVDRPTYTGEEVFWAKYSQSGDQKEMHFIQANGDNRPNRNGFAIGASDQLLIGGRTERGSYDGQSPKGARDGFVQMYR